MATRTPQVLLIGKGKSERAKKMKNLLSLIEPSQIPSVFLDRVVITLDTGQQYQIETYQLGDNGVQYDKIEQEIAKLGVSKNLAKIEVVIDLDVAQETLENETNSILDKYFV